MRILAIDTSQVHCSVALRIGDAVSQRLVAAERRHGELILAMMDGLLADAGLRATELDGFAYAHGPGSFTGLRIGAAVIQGAALASDKPVVGVSTLAALAEGCRRRRGSARVLCALDARMAEVYFGVYAADAQGLMQPLCEDVVAAPASIQPPDDGPWALAGSGWSAYPEPLAWARPWGGGGAGEAPGLDEVDQPCEARDVALLAAVAFEAGLARAPEEAVPLYLRDRVTHRS
jgi:tRNA threonylcarbamoyladenosine biosynthesis protein TsaB